MNLKQIEAGYKLAEDRTSVRTSTPDPIRECVEAIPDLVAEVKRLEGLVSQHEKLTNHACETADKYRKKMREKEVTIARLKKENEWVSVADHPPEKDGQIWICYEKTGYTYVAYYQPQYKLWQSFNINGGWSDIHKKSPPSHWKPITLPNPKERGCRMSREILFRGKRVHGRTNEWVYGDLVTGPNYRGIGQFSKTCTLKTTYEVDPATVGQFTGKCDKKMRKIFQGDVYECEDGKIVVTWCSVRSGYILKGPDGQDYSLLILDSIDYPYLGNIHTEKTNGTE